MLTTNGTTNGTAPASCGASQADEAIDALYAWIAPPAAPAPAPLPEAPASCNVYVTISGHKVQVTLRDHNEHRMLERLQVLLQQYPVQAPASPQGQGKEWCAIHNVTMQLNQKDGRRWESHRLEDGSWCKGK